MKKILIAIALMANSCAMAQTKPKVYLNPGHGSWGPDDRPLATIPYPMLSETGRPDTCGFYESNTNLWKTLELGRILKERGYSVKHSRRQNGPFPYVAGASNAEKYNKPLSVIAAEVDNYHADYFISVHSNAAADGSLANYPLFLYRGTDDQQAVYPSREMCEAMWPYHVEAMKAGFEFQSYYTSSTNIRGDRSFYNYTWQNEKGYFGYLGVLMHACPGYLVEGYFHTYQPARHRALNADWCRMEGRRYARGVLSYFGDEPDSLGCIMSDVRCMSKKTSSLDYYTAASNTADVYMPLNGATVRLKNEDGQVLSTYQVDNNYNGIFVFTDLKPGTYYVDLYCPGYRTQQTKTKASTYTVKANETTYKHHYMVVGETTELEDPADGITMVPDDDTVAATDRLSIRLYDLSGHLVARTTRQELESIQLPRGVYTIVGHDGKAVKYRRN